MTRWIILGACLLACEVTGWAAEVSSVGVGVFPPALSSYNDAGMRLWTRLSNRASAEPFNVVALVIFGAAILHTFLAPKFMHLSHVWKEQHRRKLAAQGLMNSGEVSFKAEAAHFFGEVEVVFGLWVVPLLVCFIFWKGWGAAESYLSGSVHFTEPMFVVVVMAIAATRPVMIAAERTLDAVSKLFGGSLATSWMVTLTLGPLLGSLITEPAAMTISALLLAKKFFETNPKARLAYATLGVLFVNISIGGTLTNFAAPPVLMVASKWGWSSMDMVMHFGWRSASAIVTSNVIYYLVFRKEFQRMNRVARATGNAGQKEAAIPSWVVLVHLLFLGWTVFTAHYPVLFIGGFLFFLGFTAATEHHQAPLTLRPALLVGFFLAALVIHGGLQSWWIAPVLESMGRVGLFFSAVVLTAFNDNAAITYLASLVPDLSAAMKYSVVAGAVAGGGLTVIANAPNPAGQAVLSKYFPGGVSPLYLFLGALMPTLSAILFFMCGAPGN